MAFNRDRNSRPSGGFRPRPSFSSGGRSASGWGDRGSRGPVEMHQAVCDNCGRDCQVPFRPTQGKPIYCSNCFESRNRDFGPKRFENRVNEQAASFTGSKDTDRFEALNRKLDKIIELLTPKPLVEVVKEENKESEPIESKPAKKKSPKKIK